MAWGEVRALAYQRQDGKCSICGRPLPRKFVLHHIVNKSCGGKETLDNSEARCPECERIMHEQFSHGNYNDPPQNHVSKKHRQRPKKSVRSYTPKLKTKKHRNHIAPVWHYFTHDEMTVGFYFREKRGDKGGSLRPQVRVSGHTTNESGPLLLAVRHRVQGVRVHEAKERGHGQLRRRWPRRSRRH